MLNEIQADNGAYYQARQDTNRDVRNKSAFISDIVKDIPENYQAEKWESYELGEIYRKIEKIKNHNNLIERAKVFKDSYDNKIRGYEAEKEISVSTEEKIIASERENLLSSIERMKAEIKSAEDKLTALGDKLSDKVKIAEAQFNEKKAKLDGDMQTANEYIEKQPIDVKPLETEVEEAEKMKKHLNEYRRMKEMQIRIRRTSTAF